jgi:hypothetical protein
MPDDYKLKRKYKRGIVDAHPGSARKRKMLNRAIHKALKYSPPGTRYTVKVMMDIRKMLKEKD